MNEQKIWQKLEQMDGKLDNLLQWRAAVDERCRAHHADTEEVRKTVYGNPGSTNGLQFEVSRLMNCKKETRRWKDFWIFVLRSLVIFGIIGIIMWLMGLYKGS